MATIKKAQLGSLIKKGVKAATSANKVVIPPGLQRSLKKSQSGPTKITQYSSEAEKIAAGGPTKLQKSKTVNEFDPNYEKPYKPKKQPKVDKYGFDTRPDRNGGKHIKKAKSGGSFPDLNKDGKVTRADILKGRGVIAKKGASIKKAQDGAFQTMGIGTRKVSPNKSKYVSEDGNYKMKFKGGSDTSAPTSAVQRRTLKGFLKGAPKAAGKMALKSGGSMKKCKYGCK